MEVEIRRYQKELQIPFVYVTHNQEEALTMSDRIAVMRNGRFEQIGAKTEIYTNPASAFVATFVGHANRLDGESAEVDGAHRADDWNGQRAAGAAAGGRQRRRQGAAISSSTRTSRSRRRRSTASRPTTSTGSPARCATSSSRARPRTTSSRCRTGGDRGQRHAAQRRACSPSEPVIVRWPAGAGACFADRGAMSWPRPALRRVQSGAAVPGLVGPGALFIVVSLLLPLLSIVVFSFWRTESYELYADWNLDNYRTLLGEAAYRIFLLRSLVTAALVTAHLPRLRLAGRLFHRALRRALPAAAGAAAGGAVLHRRHPAHHRAAGPARADRPDQHGAGACSACRRSRRSCTPSSPPASASSISSSRSW